MNRREFLRSSTAVAGLFATPPLWLCSRGEAKQSCYRPGDEVDPRFRLLDNSNEHEHVPAYGSTYPWQGRFKWSEDEQRYGTPTIWLLDGRLRVIRTPFLGNVYEGVPVQINYTVRDVIRALDEALEGRRG